MKNLFEFEAPAWIEHQNKYYTFVFLSKVRTKMWEILYFIHKLQFFAETKYFDMRPVACELKRCSHIGSNYGFHGIHYQRVCVIVQQLHTRAQTHKGASSIVRCDCCMCVSVFSVSRCSHIDERTLARV